MSGQAACVSAPITNGASIIHTKPGTAEHYLKVKNNDPFDEWIELPLGKIPSRPKGQHEKDYNVFANVFPLRYLTAEHRSDQAGILRRGWLYVFLNGKLWRELQVHGQAKMNDVNLAAQRGKDVRKATSLGKSSVIVPHKIAGREQTVEMAYSEVQWSWARVQKLETDAALRGKRMETVCLAQRTGGYQPFGPQGNKAKVQHVALAYKELQSAKSPEAYWLKTSKDEANMPAVYLHDPLGVAISLAEAHEADWADMEALLHSLRTGVSPQEAQRNARLGAGAPTLSAAEQSLRTQVWAQFEVAALMQQIGFASEKHKKKYGRHLNKECLDTLLGARERKELREKISRSKAALVRFLEGEPYQIALGDYLENIPVRIIDGKAAVLYGARFLNRPPFALDAHLNPREVNVTPSGNPGAAYIDKLHDERNTAGKILKVQVIAGKKDQPAGSAAPRSVEVFQDPNLLGPQLKAIIEDKKIDLATKAGVIGAAIVEAFAKQTTWEKKTLEWVTSRINSVRVPGYPEFVVAEEIFPDLQIPDGYRAVEGGKSFQLHPVTSVTALATAGTVIYDGAGKHRPVVHGHALRILPLQFRQTDVVVHQIVERKVKTPLAKAATRFQTSLLRGTTTRPLFFALEMLNMKTAWEQLLKEFKDVRTLLPKGIALAGAAASVTEQMAECGNLWLKVAGKEQSERLAIWAGTGKVLGNFFAGVVSIFDFVKNRRENDDDAAVTYLVGGLLAIGSIWATGGLGLIVAIAGFSSIIAASYLEDDLLERFARNGPLHRPAPDGADLWQRIRASAKSMAVEKPFTEEWPKWGTVRRLLFDDYLYSFGIKATTRLNSLNFPASDTDGDGHIGWKEKTAAIVTSRLIGTRGATELKLKITPPTFAPFLSKVDFKCFYFPKGMGGEKYIFRRPSHVDYEMDDDTGLVKSVDIHYVLSDDLIQQQNLAGEFLFVCRIQPGRGTKVYPAPAEHGEERYLGLRQGSMQVQGRTLAGAPQRIGTLHDLENPNFWKKPV